MTESNGREVLIVDDDKAFASSVAKIFRKAELASISRKRVPGRTRQ